MIEKIIKELLCPNPSNWQIRKLDKETGLPIWITSAVQISTLRVDKQNRIYLIHPNALLSFDQLANMHKIVERKLEGVALIVADQLSAKFRPLFVKNNIPFVYKQKSIFAPALSLKLFDYKETQQTKKKAITETIGPFELKLIEGYLTGFILAKKYNLDELIFILSQNQYLCPKTKISRAVKQLIEMNFMTVEGRGPNRRVQFYSKSQVWGDLKQCTIKPYVKRFETTFNIAKEQYIFSGETALARFSNLSAPNQGSIGVTNKEFVELEQMQIEQSSAQTKIIFEIFKESPRLFAIEGCLNPVEVYLAFKNHPDERIQMSLEEMLLAFQLEG